MDSPFQLAAIALGSNLGDRARNLDDAVTGLRALGTVVAVSSFHDTAAELYLHQPRFLNAAALLRTSLPPAELLKELLAIERRMGRRREGVPAKGPRVIDLDLLLSEDDVLVTDALTLPHPGLHQRRFVLAPLAEIAPDYVHPVLRRTVLELLREVAKIDGPL